MESVDRTRTMNLIQMREKKSKHDVSFKGIVYQLEIMRVDDGVALGYSREISDAELTEALPPGFTLEAMKAKKPRMRCYSDYIHHRWWHKVLGVPLKVVAERGILKTKRDFETLLLETDMLDQLRVGDSKV